MLAWCVMPTHYHLALRTAEVPLWRSMRTIQGRFAQAFNRRHRLFGSLWQERYKCRLVDSDEYFRRLIAYIHLNPVAGRLARSAEAYRWSGHLELLGRRSEAELLDMHETFALLGGTVREARRAYRRLIAAVSGQEWLEDPPGAQPWWRREGASGDDPVQPAQRPRTDAMGASSGIERLQVSAEGFLAAAGRALGEHAGLLWSRRLVRAEVAKRDLIALLGVERYGVRVRDLAGSLQRNADEVSRWATRGARRRQHDARAAGEFQRIDARIAALIRIDSTGAGEYG